MTNYNPYNFQIKIRLFLNINYNKNSNKASLKTYQSLVENLIYFAYSTKLNISFIIK